MRMGEATKMEEKVPKMMPRVMVSAKLWMTLPPSRYSEKLATFGEDQIYDQKDSAGFINLWGLPDTVQALREKGLLNK